MKKIIVLTLLAFLFLANIPSTFAQNNEDNLFYLPQERTLVDQGQYTDALKLFEKGLQEATTSNNFRDMAKYKKNIGDIYNRERNFDTALSNYQEALGFLSKSEDKKLERAIYNNIGVVYAEQLNFTDAEKNYRKSLEISESINLPYGIICACNNLGNLYFKLEKHDQAVIYLNKAIETAQKSSDKKSELSVLLTLGNVLSASGKFDKAKQNFLSIIEALKTSSDKILFADALNNLAGVESNLGNYNEAIKDYKDALQIYTQYNDKNKVASVYLNIAATEGHKAGKGSIKDKITSLETAKIYFKLAEDIGNEINDFETVLYAKRKQQALSHSLIVSCSDLFKKEQDYDNNSKKLKTELKVDLTSTMDQWQEPLKICADMNIANAINEDINAINTLIDKAKQKGNNSLVADLLIDLASDYSLLKDYEKSLKAYNDAIVIKTGLSSPDLWLVYYNLGKNQQSIGKNSEALANYKLAVDTVLDIANYTPEKDRQTYKDLKQSLFVDYAALKAETGDVNGAIETIDISKISELADIFLPALKNNNDNIPIINDAKQAMEEKTKAANLSKEINIELQKPAQQQDATKVEDLQKQLQQARLDFQKTALKIQEENPQILKFLSIKPTNFRTVQHKLPADTILIVPVILEKKLLIFLGPPGDKPAKVKEIDMDTNEILSGIVGFRKVLYNAEDRPALVDSAAKLYDILIKPIESDIKSYKTLIICPFENLRYIPFQALYDGKNFLAEKFDIVNLSTSSALKISDQKSANTSKLLAFGNATEDLPSAEEEVKTIKNLFKSAKVYLRTEALRDVFDTEALNDYNVIHLATHGILNNDDPETSRLLFAGKSNNALSVSDIMAFDFANKDLIVLSACDSSIGRAKGAEVLSLGAAFEMAATPTVIASLWRVNDKSTALMMTDFYKNLSEGNSRIESLRKAQLKLIKDHKYSSPYYWAPFILMGEWQ